MMNNSKKTTGVYVHIPFCVRKCSYCDFLSFAAEDNTKERYIDALCREITEYCKDKEITADSVFIGGGTPSVLEPELMIKLITTLKSCIDLTDDCEITVEANPGTMDRNKAAVYKKAGINRISLGVQSMNDDILSRLGRIHRRKEFLETFKLLREEGFDNINTDLMFALPSQSFELWKETLEEIISLKPEHISFYGLIIEEGTPFYEEWCEGRLHQASDEDDRRMYHYAVSKLKEEGYIHYEISNAALPGRASRHNLKYWSMEEYTGFGLGAHSFAEGVRYENTHDMDEYLSLYSGNSGTGAEKHIILNRNTVKDDAEEFIFTGLRKIEGVYRKDFLELTGRRLDEVYSEEIQKMAAEGLLEDLGDRIALTSKGLDISNYVMREFIKEEWKE